MDGLRGLAVVFILIYHFFPAPAAGEYGTLLAYSHRLTRFGFSGIDLFFVLSGYFIGSILSRKSVDCRVTTNFYRRRVLRIVPAAWSCTAITLTALALGFYDRFSIESVVHNYPPWEYFGFVSNLRLAYNLSWEPGSPLAHFWSLGVEMQFYLLAPLIFAVLKRTHSVAIALVSVALVTRLVLWNIDANLAFGFQFLPFCRADGFGLGIAAAGILAKQPWRDTAARHRNWLVSAWLICGAWFLWLVYSGIDFRLFALAGIGYTMVAAFYALLVVLLSLGFMARMRQLLCHPWIVAFGLYSYFIYLFQGLAGDIIAELGELLPANLIGSFKYLQLPLTTALLLVIAPWSWRLLEKPMIQWQGWTSRNTPSSTCA